MTRIIGDNIVISARDARRTVGTADNVTGDHANMHMKLQGQTARLAAYGAYAVCVGLLAVFAFIVWLTRPVPTGGMNWGMAALTWIAVGVVVIVVSAAHIAMTGQLLEAAKRP
jgi:uncharacterized RDD family membrane protein YckC